MRRASVISGCATATGTKRYFQQILENHPQYKKNNCYQIPKSLNGLHVSRLACATHTMSDASQNHIDTLREALLCGINTVHISSSKAPSSRLTHKVLHDLLKVNRLQRDELILISSFGFTNHYTKKFRMYKLKTNLYYCIDPKFLTQQLQLLLETVNLETLDILMLIQPEILLTHLQNYNQVEQFWEEYTQATKWIQNLINESIVTHWGVCSTAISQENDKNGLTLERLLNHSIKPSVIQIPSNPLESDFRFNRGTHGGILSSQLQQKNIWTIGYRPFHAVQNGQLVRLAGDTSPAPDGGASSVAELNKQFTRLIAQEKKIQHLLLDQHFCFDERLPAPSAYLEQYKDYFPDTNSFDTSLLQIRKHLQKTFNFLQVHSEPKVSYILESLESLTNNFFVLWRKYINACYQKKIEHCQNFIEKTDPAYIDKPLSLQGLLYLLSQDVPSTILVSIKAPNQIKQITKIFSLDLPSPSSNLSTISTLEEALETFDQSQSIG